MSKPVVIKSVADLENAIEWAGDNPKARWYVARLAKAFRRADLIPDEWDADNIEDFREQPIRSEEEMARSALIDRAVDGFADTIEDFNAGGVDLPEAEAVVASLMGLADHDGVYDEVLTAITAGASTYVDNEFIDAPVMEALLAAAAMVRKVRSAAGVKRYKAPIGTPIIKKDGKWVADLSRVRLPGGDDSKSPEGPHIATNKVAPGTKAVLTHVKDLEVGDEFLDNKDNPRIVVSIDKGDKKRIKLTVENADGEEQQFEVNEAGRVRVFRDEDDVPEADHAGIAKRRKDDIAAIDADIKRAKERDEPSKVTDLQRSKREADIPKPPEYKATPLPKQTYDETPRQEGAFSQRVRFFDGSTNASTGNPRESEADFWSPGPLPRSAWVRHDDGEPFVVKIQPDGTVRKVNYTLPEGLDHKNLPTREELANAEDILKRQYAADEAAAAADRANRGWMGRNRKPEMVVPKEEFDAARSVIARQEKFNKAADKARWTRGAAKLSDRDMSILLPNRGEREPDYMFPADFGKEPEPKVEAAKAAPQVSDDQLLQQALSGENPRAAHTELVARLNARGGSPNTDENIALRRKVTQAERAAWDAENTSHAPADDPAQNVGRRVKVIGGGTDGEYTIKYTARNANYGVADSNGLTHEVPRASARFLDPIPTPEPAKTGNPVVDDLNKASTPADKAEVLTARLDEINSHVDEFARARTTPERLKLINKTITDLDALSEAHGTINLETRQNSKINKAIRDIESTRASAHTAHNELLERYQKESTTVDPELTEATEFFDRRIDQADANNWAEREEWADNAMGSMERHASEAEAGTPTHAAATEAATKYRARRDEYTAKKNEAEQIRQHQREYDEGLRQARADFDAKAAETPAPDAKPAQVYRVGGGYQQWVIGSTNKNGTVNLIPAPGSAPASGKARNRKNVKKSKLVKVKASAPAPKAIAATESNATPATTESVAGLKDGKRKQLDATGTYNVGRGYQAWKVDSVNDDGTVNLSPTDGGPRRRWNVAPKKLIPTGEERKSVAKPKVERRSAESKAKTTAALADMKAKAAASRGTPEADLEAMAPMQFKAAREAAENTLWKSRTQRGMDPAEVADAQATFDRIKGIEQRRQPAPVPEAPPAPIPFKPAAPAPAPKKGMSPRVYAALIAANEGTVRSIEAKRDSGTATDADMATLANTLSDLSQLRRDQKAGLPANTTRVRPPAPAKRPAPTADDFERAFGKSTVEPATLPPVGDHVDEWGNVDKFHGVDDGVITEQLTERIAGGDLDSDAVNELIAEQLKRAGVEGGFGGNSLYAEMDHDTLKLLAHDSALQGDWVDVSNIVQEAGKTTEGRTQQKIMDLINDGHDPLEAEAQATGKTYDVVERERAMEYLKKTYVIRSGRFEEALSAAYDQELELELIRAESETNGYFTNTAAQRRHEMKTAGLSDNEIQAEHRRQNRVLWTGNANTARSQASDELKAWWDKNGRLSKDAFRARVIKAIGGRPDERFNNQDWLR